MTAACIAVPGIGIDRLGAVIAASSSLHPTRLPVTHVRGWLRTNGFHDIEARLGGGTPLVWLRATR